MMLCEWKSVGTNGLAIELKTDKDMEMERDRKGERERDCWKLESRVSTSFFSVMS